MMPRRNWSRRETILAFELYCTLPARQVTAQSEEIITLAKMLGRTPNAIKLKLQNFKAYDPNYTQNGRVGLGHGSQIDQEIVREFFNHWDTMVREAASIKYEMGFIPTGRNREQITSTRINQNFFRAAVLSSYNDTCCITGISFPALLTASHIKPWSVSEDAGEKTNPQNGLCLNAFHDRAFDRGLFTIDTRYKIIISPRAKGNASLREWLYAYEGKQITLPSRFVPQKEFIEYHNEVIFQH